MRLREVRIAAGMTQQSLSDKSGVAREMISRAETGQVMPELGTLVRLAKALGCSLDDLVTDDILPETN